MAHSLEVREPLMDHPLVEWLASLPPSLKVRGGEGKYLLKKAMEPHLPNDMLYRPEDGLRRAARARGSAGRCASACATRCCGELGRHRLVRARATCEHLVDAHQSGRRDYSAPLWTLLMFDAFLRLGERPGGAAPAALEPRAVATTEVAA